MDNPFFTALEGNGFKANELMTQTQQVLMPFMHYLNNSIKALENKEVSCKWKPIATQRYRLVPNNNIYLITPISEVQIHQKDEHWYEVIEVDGANPENGFEPSLTAPVTWGKGKDFNSVVLNEGHYRKRPSHQIYLPDVTNEIELVAWCGYQLRIRPLLPELHDLSEVHIDSHPCKVRFVQGSRIGFEGHVESHSRLSINGQNTQFDLISSLDRNEIATGSPLQEGSGWQIFASKKPDVSPHLVKDVTALSLKDMTLECLTLDGNRLEQEEWGLEADNNGLFLVVKNPTKANLQNAELACTRYPGLSFQVSEVKGEEKWIQLIENDLSDDTGKSDLDYFFGENTKILDSTQRKNDVGYRVLKARPEERQVLLTTNNKGKKRWQSEYPSSKDNRHEIRVSVDTSQLKRQKDAINQLMNRPSSGHASLIKLLQQRENSQWSGFAAEIDVDWKVLTNAEFDGCDQQRDFVRKALKTPDFAILDGPPGTGKTTTILELIMQLTMKGQRVLLSASTHAAINNVLERIKENKTLSESIFPLRIGDESNAIGVEEYQFDNLLQQTKSDSACNDVTKQLMVDASNLVCGTTIGILRLFNDPDISLDRGEPPFDVMIIDECSKTTFQEFLVPARFAKRWVLVGDIRQLSPFTDREQIVANLDNLMLKPAKGKTPAQNLSQPIQQACYLLEELRGNHKNPYQQPILVPVKGPVIQALSDEINARSVHKHLNYGLENILLILKQRTSSKNFPNSVDVSLLEREPWYLYAKSLCFIDEDCLRAIQPMIPDDMLVLHPDWPRTTDSFKHKASGADKIKPLKIKKDIHTETAEIHRGLMERLENSKWSEEICWRLEREYWLRLSKSRDRKTEYLSETLERLFPKSVTADGRIHILKDIAFPSILEALSGEGLVKRKKDDPTTLNQGFRPGEKVVRHTTLTHQHRMHPDISKFPRDQFYPSGVLKDGSKTGVSREWSYKRYKKRNAWINVQGKVSKNANHQEVKVIIRELKAFCDWAQTANEQKYQVAVLTFYKGQEKALREAMQKELVGNKERYARFNYKGVAIKLATVDYFQGQEADLVLLSMVNTERDGFIDSPNRLNVAITRARYQLALVGYHHYFLRKSKTEELNSLAESCCVLENINRNETGKSNEQ